MRASHVDTCMHTVAVHSCVHSCMHTCVEHATGGCAHMRVGVHCSACSGTRAVSPRTHRRACTCVCWGLMTVEKTRRPVSRREVDKTRRSATRSSSELNVCSSCSRTLAKASAYFKALLLMRKKSIPIFAHQADQEGSKKSTSCGIHVVWKLLSRKNRCDFCGDFCGCRNWKNWRRPLSDTKRPHAEYKNENHKRRPR